MARSKSGFKRAGELVYGSSGTLPRAQERVRRLSPLDSLFTVSQASAAFHEAAEDYALGRKPQHSYARLSPAKRFFRGYEALRVLKLDAPNRVMFCIRRKLRKEVLFALGKAGFSGSTRGRYRRTADSQWRC